MCGRYTNDLTWAEVHAFSQPLQLRTPAEDPAPAYNIAPTQAQWVIATTDDGACEARPMKWGLVPAWSKDGKPGFSTINARVETAASKPFFRAAWKSRRCLVPASGYYEWRAETEGKQPYWIHPSEGRVLMFAGLWECWRDELETFSIVTGPAATGIDALHARMPLALAPAVLADWLHGTPEQAGRVAATAAIELAWHPVGREVGNVRNQGAGLVERLGTPGPTGASCG